MSQKKEKEKIKINKKHGGKEFKSWFHFVGKLEKHQKYDMDTSSWNEIEILRETTTTTNKPRRAFQVDVLTEAFNRLKVESAGMEFEMAYPYSGEEGTSHPVAWKDRFDKSKYPNDSYHLFDTDWDKTEKLGKEVEALFASGEEVWVEIKGKYEFDEYNGKPIVKRIVNTIAPIKTGDKIKVAGKEIEYVCDFKDENFIEVNHFFMQIGIRSAYQDENTKDTKVNATFLANGKERSAPKDVELMVYYKEAAEGKRALADAFAGLNQYDFAEVEGVDNNRAEYTMVPVEVKSTDPFADVDETTTQMKRATAGSRRGLEITSAVKGSHVSEMLTETELVKLGVTDRTQQRNNYDPFADDGKPIDILDSELPF